MGSFRDIGAHGDDGVWLRRHLSSAVTGADGGNRPGGWDDPTRDEQNWSREDNTCGPGSTIGARAVLDPVHAPESTGCPSGQEDDGAAFRERPGDEPVRGHEEGRSYDFGFRWGAPDGRDGDGRRALRQRVHGSGRSGVNR
ncbi:hypothetical protein SUDANB6_01516 [Streptomyces sp. enrichment culture]|uniref:hypothetical protein n=1 Tax=Streptomyces sp. enrichment culture TaxID=1795815 RepID=UPI003F55567E